VSKICDVDAVGRSGNKYAFQVYSLDTTFKSLPGVYIFLSSSNHNPVYVGETGDLSCRFDDHHKAGPIRQHGADRIGVLLEQDAERRLAIERDLLSNYNWPCNG
jgi:hypothetical protein